MWRHRPEPEITSEEVSSIMSFLMRIDAKVEIRSFLLEDEDEQEDS